MSALVTVCKHDKDGAVKDAENVILAHVAYKVQDIDNGQVSLGFVYINERQS